MIKDPKNSARKLLTLIKMLLAKYQHVKFICRKQHLFHIPAMERLGKKPGK
jgi:hypothetical protein